MVGLPGCGKRTTRPCPTLAQSLIFSWAGLGRPLFWPLLFLRLAFFPGRSSASAEAAPSLASAGAVGSAASVGANAAAGTSGSLHKCRKAALIASSRSSRPRTNLHARFG
jgi:hypothetical protein